MKRIFAALIVFCITFAACGFMVTAAGNDSYPMICRGGGNIAITVYTIAISDPKKSRHDVGKVGIKIHFKKSMYAGKDRKPGPGECSWLDRTIGKNEPTELIYEGRGMLSSVHQSSSMTKISVANLQIQKLIDLIKSGELFYVYCKRDVFFFRITRIGL